MPTLKKVWAFLAKSIMIIYKKQVRIQRYEPAVTYLSKLSVISLRLPSNSVSLGSLIGVAAYIRVSICLSPESRLRRLVCDLTLSLASACLAAHEGLKSISKVSTAAAVVCRISSRSTIKVENLEISN